MRIYTGSGDKGETSVLGGKRIKKDDPRVELIGALDELNSHIGVARAFSSSRRVDGILDDIQHDLFCLGSDVAAPLDARTNKPVPRIRDEDVRKLENIIDEVQSELPAVKNFVLPGGSRDASLLHTARTICRRTERSAVALSSAEEINPGIVKYLGRLSDLLYSLARLANKIAGFDETKWFAWNEPEQVEELSGDATSGEESQRGIYSGTGMRRPMPDPTVDEIGEEVKNSSRPDQYDWVGLAKRQGYNFVLEVIRKLTPDVLPLFPKLNDTKHGNQYTIPVLHSDMLWMYAQFIAMYKKNPRAATEWFKSSL